MKQCNPDHSITYLWNVSVETLCLSIGDNIMVSNTDCESSKKIRNISKFQAMSCSQNPIFCYQGSATKMRSWELKWNHPGIFIKSSFGSIYDFQQNVSSSLIFLIHNNICLGIFTESWLAKSISGSEWGEELFASQFFLRNRRYILPRWWTSLDSSSLNRSSLIWQHFFLAKPSSSLYWLVRHFDFACTSSLTLHDRFFLLRYIDLVNCLF